MPDIYGSDWIWRAKMDQLYRQACTCMKWEEGLKRPRPLKEREPIQQLRKNSRTVTVCWWSRPTIKLQLQTAVAPSARPFLDRGLLIPQPNCPGHAPDDTSES